MGSCNSTNSSNVEVIKEIIDPELNFEKHREEYRDKPNDKVFEVKADLYEITSISNRIKHKNLISKYLFFTPDGKFTSSVSKTMFSDIIIEGWLNPKSSYLTLITKQNVKNDKYLLRTYEGKLNMTDQSCQIEGKIMEDNSTGKVLVEKSTFILNFLNESGDIWEGKYEDSNNKIVNIRAYINLEDLIYTGLAVSEKGIAVIRGMDKGSDSNLIIQYLNSDESKTEIFNIKGVLDSIGGTFDGIIKHRDLNANTKINFKVKSKM